MKRAKIIYLVIFILFQGTVCRAEMTTGNAQIFNDAAKAYTKGNYEKAIQLYEEMVTSGLKGGNLYFNLANSYYKNEEYGKARLYYERALSFAPRDKDVRFNYNFLLSKIGQRGYNENQMIDALFKGFHENFTLNELVLMVIVLISSGFLLSGFFVFFRWPSKYNRFLLVVVLILFVVIARAIQYKVEMQDVAIILNDTKAMFEPKENSTTHFKLFEGAKVRVLGGQANWKKIQRPDGKRGWVKPGTLEMIYSIPKDK